MRALWVDDLRSPPPGWEWAQSSKEAIDLLQRHHYDQVSLDHDLGENDTTRMIVLYWCEHGDWPEVITVHSANPVGREWLEGMIDRYKP